MSYTQFVATATAQIQNTFNLDDYLVSLVDFVANHLDDLPEDFQIEVGDYNHEDLVEVFSEYVRVLGDKILVECDTEERNGNSMIWDWICDQVRQDVMISNVMEIHSATIDSRSGVDTTFGFYKKDGTWIGSDDMVKLLEDNKLM